MRIFHRRAPGTAVGKSTTVTSNRGSPAEQLQHSALGGAAFQQGVLTEGGG